MKKTLAIMLALIMVLALVPTVAFAAGNTIYVDAYKGKGISNHLDVVFKYEGSQVGSGKEKVYILQNGQLTGKASNNADKADPGIIIKDGIAYKFSHAGIGVNLTKLKDVYYNSSNGKWYYNYTKTPIPFNEGRINFVYKITGDNTYILNYDANGGENAPESKTQVKKSSASANFTISNEKPFRNGYNFLGWSDTKNGTVKYKAGENLTLTYTSDVTEKTIYAVWEKIQPPVTIDITYNGNAGNDVVSNLPDPTTSTIPNGQYYAPFTISNQVPTRNGYDFLGWADSADAAEPQYQPGSTIDVSGDTYFYAVWKATEIKPDIPTPTIDNIDGNIQVNVTCNSANKSKTYGLIPGGFTPTPLMLNNGVYECTITAIPSVYCDKYTADTEITHEPDTNFNNNDDNFKARTLTLQYDSTDKKWNPIGYVNPLPVGVKCEKNSHGEQQETTGTLIVTKTVTGNEGDKNKDFTFTVTLKMPEITVDALATTIINATPGTFAAPTPVTETYGDVTFINGVATFTLKHNESKTIKDIPAGYTYTVTESDNAGYTVTSENDEGTIEGGKTADVKFTNTRGSTPTPTPTPYNGGGGHGHYHTTTTPVPVIVIPPKTGDMTVWQSILHFLGIR